MTYKNKRRYHKPKRTYKNKRRSHLKKKRTMRTKRGGMTLGKELVKQTLIPPGTSLLAEGAKTIAKKGVDYVKNEAVDQLGKLVNHASGSKPSQSVDPTQLLEQIQDIVEESDQKKEKEKSVSASIEKEKKIAADARETEIKRLMEKYGDKVASSPPPVATATLSKSSDQRFVNKEVEYEERQVKKGLVAFPKDSETDFFKLKLNGTHASEFKGITVSLSYASMRGKAFKKMLKSVPNPSNYYFKVTNLPDKLKSKNVYVSARHVIIDPSKAKDLGKYLHEHKGYYLVVGHYENDGTNEYLYRLPHRGYIDCEGKNIVLMTTSGDTIEYPITKNPNYRFIGLKKDDGHGELITMMEALLVLKGKPELLTLKNKFLEELGKPSEPPTSSVKDIVRFNLSKLKKPKDGSKILDDLYSLVSGGCDHDKARKRLVKDMETSLKEKATKPGTALGRTTETEL